MRAMNIIPTTRKRTVSVSTAVSPSTESTDNDNSSDDDSDVDEDNNNQQQKRARSDFPARFRVEYLRTLLTGDNVSMDELAAMEYAVSRMKEFDGVMTSDILRLEFEEHDIPVPDVLDFDTIVQMTTVQSGRAQLHINIVRKEMLDAMPCGVFQPKSTEYLYQWLSHGREWTTGARPATRKHKNFELHPSNGRRALTDTAAHCIRHILYCYKVPLTRFSGLWNAFCVLIMGRSLALEEFASVTSIYT